MNYTRAGKTPEQRLMSLQPPFPFENLLELSTMSLATCNQDGEPHAAPVYFAADRELRFYFFSEPESRHGQDLAHNPRAAAAIYPEVSDWRAIHGLQMHGEARCLQPGAEWEHAWQVYRAKFPFVEALKEVLARNSLYVLRPSWLRLVDNRRGFGFKQEWRLD